MVQPNTEPTLCDDRAPPFSSNLKDPFAEKKKNLDFWVFIQWDIQEVYVVRQFILHMQAWPR